MRSRVAFVLTTILVVSAFLMPAAAAAAQSSPGPRSFSSLVDIERYLTSMRIDFGGATIQLGSRNYAGPDCPGSGWSCTTASVVIQFGNTNFAEVRDCTPSESTIEPGPDSCDIVQVSSGGNNMARCFIDTRDVSPAAQTCTITQENANGGDNKAEVHLFIKQKTGSTQMATQMATVMQTQLSGSGDNTSNVDETIDENSNEGDTQSQDAHQTAMVTQTSDSGRNFSDIHQSQKQSLHTEESGLITQGQNTPCTGYNVWADVDQASATGANESHLDQSIDQDEHAPKADDGSQQQGYSLLCGGLSGHVDQASSGKSRTTNHQTEKQAQMVKKDSSVSQSQFGPVYCCLNQGTNTADRFDIDQSSDQNSNGTLTTQETTLEGTYTTTGDGRITQRATNNTDRETNECSDTPSCTIFITCVDEEGGSVCTPVEPPGD